MSGNLPRKKSGTKKLRPGEKVSSRSNVKPKFAKNQVQFGPNFETMTNFFLNQSQPTTPFTETDARIYARLPNKPNPSSLAEAAVVVGILKQIIQPKSRVAGYEETDLYSNEMSSNKTNAFDGNHRRSLEVMTLERKISLARALNQNPLLKSYDLHRMALLALNKSKNSPSFDRTIREVINNQIALWTSLHTEQSGISSPMNSAYEIDIPETEKSAAPPLSAADLRSGDSLLVEAQSLANNKRFEDAIIKAGLISEGSPLYPAARNKIVVFSNDAVQELRKKSRTGFSKCNSGCRPNGTRSIFGTSKRSPRNGIK